MPDSPERGCVDDLSDSRDLSQQRRSVQDGEQREQYCHADNLDVEAARVVKLPPFWKKNPALWLG